MNDPAKGYAVLRDAARNKSIAFSQAEREEFGLRGLLPYQVSSIETQEQRVLQNIRRKAVDIERYIYLVSLMERNQVLFYRTLINNIEEMMSLIYTPTVGQACKEFGQIFRRPQGFYITPDDRGSVREILDNWPEGDVRVVVVTDGERILGLGDLGANGMGIPIGKLSLYCACAGIHPHQCLPVMLDVGTNNKELLNDTLYLGYPHERLSGDEYTSLVDEFVEALQDKFPDCLLQFEDFLTPNAFALLNRYRDKLLCFNDDIQGTAAVAAAGVYASTRVTGVPVESLRIMFLGAGSAATGIGGLLVQVLQEQGLSETEARQRLWFNDSEGLVVASRDKLAPHKRPYAHDHKPLQFLQAINEIKPHVLIGATGVPGVFTREVIEAMTEHCERPTIFALSNPTSRTEATAEQVYEWSAGKALFASGSPFEPVEIFNQTFVPGQGNNVYIFPGIGLGALACAASTITDRMFLVAAQTLAAQIEETDLARGTLYPPLANIRAVSKEIALAVAECAFSQNVAGIERPDNLSEYIEGLMYEPVYS